MFAQKLVREAKEHAAALKEKLVALYNQLQSGDVTPEKRAELAKAIEEVKGKLEAQTKRLCGDQAPPEPAPK
jgi:K+-sensing histidine kinase KdpD